MKTKIILVLAVFVLLAVLLAQNTGIVTYRLLFWTVSLSQVIIVPLVALVGFVLGFVIGAARRRMKGPKP
ncbi:MAG: LapA family protein [Candidatus Aminicenantales bacterium]